MFTDSRSELSGLRFMTNDFDVVPVGIEDKRCVVLTTVLRTQSRRSIALTACIKSGVVERVDLLPALGYECDVQVRGLLVSLVQAQ